jgi:hypothetical protein
MSLPRATLAGAKARPPSGASLTGNRHPCRLRPPPRTPSRALPMHASRGPFAGAKSMPPCGAPMNFLRKLRTPLPGK